MGKVQFGANRMDFVQHTCQQGDRTDQPQHGQRQINPHADMNLCRTNQIQIIQSDVVDFRQARLCARAYGQWT